MQRRFRWMLSGLTSVVLLGAGVPVFAASGLAPNGLLKAKYNPYAGDPPMTAWAWFSSAGGPTFLFGTNAEAFPFPIVPQRLAQAWQAHPIDNPAPLIWYYQHVSKTDFGNSVFGNGVKYSLKLIRIMKSDHFAPALVGGVNPPNWNAVPAPSKPISPISVNPANPNAYPQNTTVLGWKWLIGTGSHQATFQFSFHEPSGSVGAITGTQTVHGSWIQFPQAWARVDSVTVLKDFAAHAPRVFEQTGLAPKNLGLHYSADLAAAMTVQNFNPGSLGMQPLAPSPKALTPATETWLIKHGWGDVLAKYATSHHLTLPSSTKKASKAKHL